MAVLSEDVNARSLPEGSSIRLGGGSSHFNLQEHLTSATASPYVLGLGTELLNVSSATLSNYQIAVALDGLIPSDFSYAEKQYVLGMTIPATSGKMLQVVVQLRHASGKRRCQFGCEIFQKLAYGSLLSGDPVRASGLLALQQDDLFPVPRISNSERYQYTRAEGGFAFHPFPGALLDPYIVGKLGIGICNVDYLGKGSCRAWMAGAGAGIEINVMENLYLYFEGERIMQAFNTSHTSGEVTYSKHTPTYFAPALTAGIGIRF